MTPRMPPRLAAQLLKLTAMLSESCCPAWLPRRVNTGPWLSHYTIDELEILIRQQLIILPICSLATPPEQVERLGPLLLPPLYSEALDDDLKAAILSRMNTCFPYLEGSRRRGQASTQIDIVELPAAVPPDSVPRPKILAFSVDPAVEQHGPHLPLATDRIQSYAVLAQLAKEVTGLVLAPPVDYGHLTWGLARGLSIDVPPALLSHYVARYAAALAAHYLPDALYVVDVHGSPVHRRAVEAGLAASGVPRWRFRWLHQPLVEFAADRGDQHAGGVETSVIEAIDPNLLDPRWWPARLAELATGEMTFDLALQLQNNLTDFVDYAEANPWNGIVGRILNYREVTGRLLMERMVEVARQDIRELAALSE
jgi:creatinine amidohydrolase/Fe(II)-dependent formamide hydrolase-like protein